MVLHPILHLSSLQHGGVSTHEYSGAVKMSGMVERQNPMITKVNRFVCESEHDMQDNKPLA
jgi:hypothetical protein